MSTLRGNPAIGQRYKRVHPLGRRVTALSLDEPEVPCGAPARRCRRRDSRCAAQRTGLPRRRLGGAPMPRTLQAARSAEAAATERKSATRRITSGIRRCPAGRMQRKPSCRSGCQRDPLQDNGSGVSRRACFDPLPAISASISTLCARTEGASVDAPTSLEEKICPGACTTTRSSSTD